MTRKFVEKVLKEITVDTKKYRYQYREGLILRIPINCLDTNAIYDSWEIAPTLWNYERRV